MSESRSVVDLASLGLTLDHSLAALDPLEAKILALGGPKAIDERLRNEIIAYIKATHAAALAGKQQKLSREPQLSFAFFRVKPEWPGTLRDTVELWCLWFRRAILKDLKLELDGKRAALRADLAAAGTDPGPLTATGATLDRLAPLLPTVVADPVRRRRVLWNTCALIIETVHAAAPGVKFIFAEGPSHDVFGELYYDGFYLCRLVERFMGGGQDPEDSLASTVAQIVERARYLGHIDAPEPKRKKAAAPAPKPPVTRPTAIPKLSPRRHLEATEAALAAGDRRLALEHALAAWRPTRDGAIGDAIDAITRDAVAELAAPNPARKAAFDAAWLELLRSQDVVAQGWCALHLTTKSARPWERTEAAAKLAPDPRFVVGRDAEGVLVLRQRHPLAFGDERLRELLFERHGEKVPKGFPITERVPAGERQRWLALGKRPDATASVAGEALLAAIYAAPADDPPRAVYADHLQELGDPRGTFIAMQLAVAAGKAEPTKALVDQGRKYGRVWAGGLNGVADALDYRRGFPSRVHLNLAAKVKYVEAVLDDPAWATIERISGRAPGPVKARALQAKHLRALVEVELDSDPVLEALEVRPLASIERVVANDWKGGARMYPKRFAERVLPLLARLPNVTSLAIAPEQLDNLLASPLAARLRELDLGRSVDLAVLAKLPRTLATVWLAQQTLAVKRARGRVTLRITDDDLDRRLLAEALALPGVVRVEVTRDDLVANLARRTKLPVELVRDDPERGAIRCF